MPTTFLIVRVFTCSGLAQMDDLKPHLFSCSYTKAMTRSSQPQKKCGTPIWPNSIYNISWFTPSHGQFSGFAWKDLLRSSEVCYSINNKNPLGSFFTLLQEKLLDQQVYTWQETTLKMHYTIHSNSKWIAYREFYL